MIDGLQLGTIEAYIGPADFYVGVDPRLGVFSAPMLFKDNDHASATVLDPALNQEHPRPGRAQGHGRASAPSGSARRTMPPSRPILKLADFSGKKLRVNATAMEREKMARLGATAVPMPLNEVLPSLQRGVIDGTMSGTSVFVSMKFNDVVKTITVTNDTMLVSLAVVSKVWLDKLPPDLRKIVIDHGKETQIKTNKWEQEFSKGLEKTWAEMGGQMHRAAGRRPGQDEHVASQRGRRREQGSAAGPRHAQEGPRCRGQALSAAHAAAIEPFIPAKAGTQDALRKPSELGCPLSRALNGGGWFSADEPRHASFASCCATSRASRSA